MAKEGIPFTKYTPLYELKAQHKIYFGISNNVSMKFFTHYIVESQWKAHKKFVEESVSFLSFLMDGTTDVNEMEDQVVLMLYCKKDDFVKEIKSCMRYLSVANPNRTNTNGLLQCLGNVVKQTMGIQDICEPSGILKIKPVLVGGGSDGASVCEYFTSHSTVVSEQYY